jgi:hypothetical protein
MAPLHEYVIAGLIVEMVWVLFVVGRWLVLLVGAWGWRLLASGRLPKDSVVWCLGAGVVLALLWGGK